MRRHVPLHTKYQQRGSLHLAIPLLIIVALAIGFIGYRIQHKSSAATVASYNDTNSGFNLNQFSYVGTWKTSLPPGAFKANNHFTEDTTAVYKFRFSGTQVKVYSEKNYAVGIAAYSIDGGPEKFVDSYAATRQDQVLVYTSPLLASGSHTLRVRNTIQKNSASAGNFMVADRVDLITSTVVTPPPPPPPSDTSSALVGIYNGGTAEDDATKATFGGYPDVASSYYQPTQAAFNVSAEEARVNKGIRPLITITSKGTQYLSDIANKSGTGWTWIQTYVNSLATLNSYANSKGVKVYATLDHEYEVKVNQGLITGTAATDAVYARALSNFYSLVDAKAPSLVTVYWYGGFDKTDISAIGNGLTVKPDMYTFDPYSSSDHASTETFEQLVKPKVDWLRTQPWFVEAPKPVGLSEFGANHSDSAMATNFYPDLRTHLRNMDLDFAVLFNRTDPPYAVELTTSGYPASVKAMANSLAAQ